MKKINSEEIHLILSNVSKNNVFICSDGSKLNNLEELVNKLKTIDRDNFSNHVNENKNDFSTWIYDCLGDAKLAENIRYTKNSKSMTKKIKTRISYLKKSEKGES